MLSRRYRPNQAMLHSTTQRLANSTNPFAPSGFDTTCTFQYVISSDFAVNGYANATSVPCTPADLGSSFTFQSASATIT